MKNEVRPAPFCPSKTNPQPHKVKPPEIAAGDQSPSVSPHPGKPAAPEPSPHHEQNQDTFFRNCFISPRRRFDSTKRRLVVLERLALRRRFLETSAKCNWRAAAAAASNLAANKRVASTRLRAWDREVLTRTERPVGKWRRVTAVETLLTCWPPGPLDRQKTSSTSFGRQGYILRPSRQMGWRTSPGVCPHKGGPFGLPFYGADSQSPLHRQNAGHRQTASIQGGGYDALGV